MNCRISPLVLMLPLSLACTGSLGGPETDGASDVPAGETPAAPPPTAADASPLTPGLLSGCDPAMSAPPPQRVWLLTQEQLQNSVSALYEGGPRGPEIAAITVENRTYDGNDADLLKLNTEQARGLIAGADAAGKFVAENLGQLVTCAAPDATCFSTFMSEFATRAWRMPPSTEQLTRLRAVYDVGAELSVADGYRLAVAAVLKSPRFVFRTEIGAADAAGRFVLSPWEIASQLSYLLFDAPPDQELRTHAASGAIAAPDVFAAQAQRLLGDARARGVASRFMLQLTSARSVQGLAKSPSVIENFDDEVTSALLEELELFSQQTFFAPGGSLTQLLTAQESIGNATLAGFYGLTSQSATAAPLGIGPQRAGFLTMPVLMSVLSQADHVVPTARGRFVLDKLLCSPIPPPPQIPSDAPAADPTLSPRERLLVMQDYPACAGCHNRADPVGFAFDHFDPVGRYVTEVKGRPVDPSGEIKYTQLTDGPFANVSELSQKLAASPEVRACINWQFAEFAQGREPTTADQCRVFGAQTAFEQSGGRLQTLIEQALSLDSMQFRSASR